MALIYGVIDLLNTLIQSIIDDTIQISKASLSDIQTCLQNAHENIEFLQLESQFQWDELQHKSCHSKLFYVQNNPLFIEIDSHQQQEYEFEVDLVPNSRAYVHVDVKV